jgi:hypothetical protein
MTITLALGRLKQEDQQVQGHPKIHSKTLSQKKKKSSPYSIPFLCSFNFFKIQYLWKSIPQKRNSSYKVGSDSPTDTLVNIFVKIA